MRQFSILMSDNRDTMTLLGEGKVIVEAEREKVRFSVSNWFKLIYLNTEQLGQQEGKLKLGHKYDRISLIEETLKLWEISLI